jgi:hypothetical protein
MKMPYRSLAASAALLAVTSLVGASAAQAQTISASRFHEDANLASAPATQVIHCGPAPLTERPGIQWEFSRPRVAPLETAFAEAARVKRSFATHRTRNTNPR